MPPALKVRASGANGTRPPAEPLHPVLPNATENPAFTFFSASFIEFIQLWPETLQHIERFSRPFCLLADHFWFADLNIIRAQLLSASAGRSVDAR